MAGRISGDDEAPIAEINVVPLVDIILVVLIIFMVTAPLVMSPVIEINLPNSKSGDQSPQKPIVVAIMPDGKLFLNNQATTLEQVTLTATELAKSTPDSVAVLSADRTITLDVFTQVYSALKSAGIKRIAYSVKSAQAQ